MGMAVGDTPAQTGGLQEPAYSPERGGDLSHRLPSGNQNRGRGNCGHYCKAEIDVSIGWLIAALTQICPECAPVTVPVGRILVPVSFTFAYTSDTFENKFLSGGFSGGKTIFPIGFDYVYSGEMITYDNGVLTTQNPSETDMVQFLTGPSLNAKIGMIESLGITWTPGVGVATEEGVFTTPQAGASGTWGWELPTWLPHLSNFVTTQYPIPFGGQ